MQSCTKPSICIGELSKNGMAVSSAASVFLNHHQSVINTYIWSKNQNKIDIRYLHWKIYHEVIFSSSYYYGLTDGESIISHIINVWPYISYHTNISSCVVLLPQQPRRGCCWWVMFFSACFIRSLWSCLIERNGVQIILTLIGGEAPGPCFTTSTRILANGSAAFFESCIAFGWEHYSDFIISAMTLQSPASQLFTQPFA